MQLWNIVHLHFCMSCIQNYAIPYNTGQFGEAYWGPTDTIFVFTNVRRDTSHLSDFPLTRPSLRSQTRTKRIPSQSSRRVSSTTTRPRTTRSSPGTREEVVEVEEELEGEAGGSRGEGRRTGGDLSSRRKAREGGAVQIGAHQKDKQRAKASFSDLVYLFRFFNSFYLLSAEAC